VSTVPPPDPLEWEPEWCIDVFTPKWRAAGIGRSRDWAIAVTSYGGLILLGANDEISEWDTGQCTWLFKSLPFREWIDHIIGEGEVDMSEMRGWHKQ
jgi:hypothetical protein